MPPCPCNSCFCKVSPFEHALCSAFLQQAGTSCRAQLQGLSALLLPGSVSPALAVTALCLQLTTGAVCNSRCRCRCRWSPWVMV